MKKNKKLLLTGLSLFSLLVLSGCVSTKNGVPTGEGLIYNLLIAPMGKLITFFAENQGLGFGFAIIIVTLLVRFLIMPLSIYQSWKSTYQTERMSYLKPILAPIQERMKNASSQEEQLAAQQEYFATQKQYGLSLFGGIGCLPILIQMPFFIALFYAARYTPGISEASFYGIDLGTPSLVLTVIVGLLYYGQSLLMQVGVDEDQKKQMKAITIINPLMIVFFSWTSPAGVTLYWVVGGVIVLIQQAITNLILKPRIRAKVEEEFKNKPLKPVSSTVKDVTPTASAIIEENTSKKKNRNAGKQRSR